MSHRSYNDILQHKKPHGEIEPHDNFDFDEIYRREGSYETPEQELAEDAQRMALELFNRILIWCFERNIREPDRALELAFRRFVVMTYLLNPRVLNVKTLTELCGQVGESKQVLSIESVSFRDTFGLEIMSGRNTTARRNMARVQMGNTNSLGKGKRQRKRI